MSKMSSIVVLCMAGILSCGSLTPKATAAEAKPTLRLCTGKEGGNYYKAGYILANQMQGSIKILPTKTDGSIDNLRKVTAGECDGAIVQKDALISFKEYEPKAQLEVKRVIELYPEYVHFICNRDKFDSRVTKLMNDKTTKVAIGETGSGQNATWRAMTVIEPRYATVPTVNLDVDEALVEVEEGRVPCMVYVSGLNSRVIKDANVSKGGKLALMNFDDADFSKIKVEDTPVYEKAKLPTNGNYSNLTGWTKPNTITTAATLVVSKAWYDANKSSYGSYLREFRQSAPLVASEIEKK